MSIIYNRFIPFGNYKAINLLGVIFARTHFGKLTRTELNHEYIHTRQMLETLIIPFYLFYLLEWFFGLIKYRNASKAYYNISFEREAYRYMDDLSYLVNRRPYSFVHYINNK